MRRENNMPTGYTAAIANGITFRQYAMDCAKAFGALITMRDEPANAEIPEKFEPSKYHIDKITAAENELKELRAMDDSEAEKRARLEFEQELESHQKYVNDKSELKDKYLAMLKQVKIWQPPTSEHVEYKNFMIQQIEQSIDFDCTTTYLSKPALKSGRVWLNGKIDRALKDLEYHKEENRKEIERAEGRTAWVNALRNSLPSA